MVDRWKLILLLFACVSLFAAGNVMRQYSHLVPDDDYLWLMWSGDRVFGGEQAANLEKAYVDHLREGGYPPLSISRAQLRYDFYLNYLTIAAGSRLAEGFAGLLPIEEISTRIAVSMYANYMGLYFAFVAVLMVMLWRHATLHQFVAVTIVVGFSLISEGILVSAGDWRFFGPGVGNIGESLLKLAYYFLAPGTGFSVFGLSGRNHFILMVLVVFILRWNGKFTASYALMPLLFLIHREYSGIALLFLLACDVVLRPQVLRSLTVLGFVVGTFIAYLGVGFLAKLIVGNPVLYLGIGVGLAAGLAGMIYAAAWHQEGMERLMPFLRPVRASGQRLGPVLGDIAVIVVLAGLSFPIAFIGYGQATDEQHAFLWRVLPSRPIGLFHLPVKVGLVLLGLNWVIRRTGLELTRTKILVLFTASVIVAQGSVIVERWRQERGPFDRLVVLTREMDRTLAVPFPPPDKWKVELHEWTIYYALVKSGMTGVDHLRPLFVRKEVD